MMISEEMNGAINEQIGHEFSASLQYVAIATHFDSETLTQLASHFYAQADEERDHAMKFVRYLVEAGGRVAIPAIPAPVAAFKTVEEAIQLSLEREKLVTRQINDLVGLAIEKKDYISLNFLNWFVTEQLEEVSSMEALLTVVRRAGESNLFHVESYLASKSGSLGSATQ